jgi:subtilase family serine protease
MEVNLIRKIGHAAVILALVTLIRFGVPPKAVAARPPQRDLITNEIDESRRVILRGNTRPEARREHDRGRVPDGFPLEHMLLQLRRPPELQQEFDTYVDSLTSGKSPNFHKWLAPEEVGTSYGLSERDLRHIELWLRRHHIRVNFVYPNHVLMDISARADELREAFHTDVHFLDVRGEKHFANMNDPEIPEALAPAIVGIVSIHDFRPHPMFHQRVPPAFTDASGNYYVTPPDMAAIYNLDPLFSQGITGAGQTVVVVEDSDPFTTADWNTFVTEFQLGKYGGSVAVTHPNIMGMPVNCTDPGYTSTPMNPVGAEVALDMEYVTGAAPAASVNVATCADTATFGGLIAINNIAGSSTHPYIISVSYGFCEPALGSAGNLGYLTAYQTAASEGISVFVAAGDQDAASCDFGAAGASNGINVSGFATTPYNVAVGGTDYIDTFNGTNTTYWNSTNSPTLQSAKGYVPEIPWNDSCASVLLAIAVFGSPVTDGADGGSCGFGIAQMVSGGSGGPSGCATGVPSTANQVSGTCAGYPKPSWQSGLLGNPNDGVRDIPDVSLFAAAGTWSHSYVYCWSDTTNGGASCAAAPDPATGSWSSAGGTSFASPILAAIQALVNQRTAALTRTPIPGQGNPNPVYYAIAKLEYPGAANANCDSSNQPLPRRGVSTSCVFYDVTQGDMDVNCAFGSPDCFGATAGNNDGALSTGAISGLSFTGGSGYTSAPACSISAPHNPNAAQYNGSPKGAQAFCTATISGAGAVNSVTLNAGGAGSGYAPLPICTLTGGGGSGATCTVTGITTNAYQPAFPTTPGWDFATGIGTINAYNLVFSTMWAEGP